MPSLTGSPQAFMTWGLIFFLPALGIFSFSGPTVGEVQGKYFQVEVLSPQYFKIKPRVPGPVSAHLLGGKSSQQLITRQENGQTVIYARIPMNATLTVRVGEYYLRLWMKNSSFFEIQEGFRPHATSPGGEDDQI
jgi:hypothetical protein